MQPLWYHRQGDRDQYLLVELGIRRVRRWWFISLERDAKQIRFHYDVSDDFYALWLDSCRVYSCSYYRDHGMMQEAKLDHIGRKLALRSGECFLDIGADWGGLLLWAAEQYDIDTTGITLSHNQHAYVNRMIEVHDFRGRTRIELLP